MGCPTHIHRIGKKLTQHQFRIEKIKLKTLYEFACETLSDRSFKNVAPISLIRAAAQVKNPHADPEDVALVMAYADSRCVGYHGLLPGFLNYNQRTSKVYWLVTFFIDQEYRGKGLGKLLVKEIIKTNIDLVTTGITKAAQKVYQSAGFRQLGQLPYFQLRVDRLHVLNSFFKHILEILKNKSDKSIAFDSIIRAIDKWIFLLTKKVFYGFALNRLKAEEKKFTSRLVDQLGKEVDKTAGLPSKAPAFTRDVKTVNWMLRHRWVVSQHEAQRDVENYYFSSVRDRFQFIALEVYTVDETSQKGYLVLSVSSRKGKTVLKFLDLFFDDPKDYTIAAYIGLKYAKAYSADCIEYPVRLSNFYKNQPLLNRLIKKKKRVYLYYPNNEDSALAVNAQKIELDYCDSDTAFT
jgi:GNAT superfamily N-acetyltransferase